MNLSRHSMTILMADDDEDDRLLVLDALLACRLVYDVRFVTNGEDLLDYLYHRGKYANPVDAPRPGLILLDLNMPRKDGREALREIKVDPQLRPIPVIVLSTSTTPEDIYQSYDLGASSYIAKPVSFDALVEMMNTIGRYWFEIVEPPSLHNF